MIHLFNTPSVYIKCLEKKHINIRYFTTFEILQQKMAHQYECDPKKPK